MTEPTTKEKLDILREAYTTLEAAVIALATLELARVSGKPLPSRLYHPAMRLLTTFMDAVVKLDDIEHAKEASKHES